MPDSGAPTGASATTDMVAALAQTEEAVMTKEGIRALTPEEQAGNSPAASVQGAPAETPVPGTETAPAPVTAPAAPAPAAPAPAATPAPAPNTLATNHPSAAPVIDASGKAIPAAPAAPAAPAPAAPAPAAPAPVVDTAPLDTLAAFVKETNLKAETAIEDARRIAQGNADKQTVVLNKKLEEASAATLEVRTRMHALEVRDLSPEDRAKAVTAFEQVDERAELDRIRAELAVTHTGIYVDSLVLEYSAYDLTRDAIEASGNSPEEMELWCEQQKSAFLQAKIDAPAAAPTTQVTAAPAAALVAPAAPVVPVPTAAVAAPVAPAPAAPAPAAPANAPGVTPAEVPAGASAPSDIGATGTSVEPWKPSEEPGMEAMKANIRNMGWEEVQLPKG